MSRHDDEAADPILRALDEDQRAAVLRFATFHGMSVKDALDELRGGNLPT